MAATKLGHLAHQPFLNNSLAFVPSPSDLFMAFPRLARQISGLFGAADDNTTLGWYNGTSDTIVEAAAQAKNPSVPPVVQENMSMLHSMLAFLGASFQKLVNFDGVSSYFASKWAISTLIIALILNRAHVYASARHPLHLNWRTRLFHRIIPIVVLGYHIISILQTLRCQTGYPLPQLRFGNPDVVINKSWTDSPGRIHQATSKILFWQDDKTSCQAVGMIPTNGDLFNFRGSATLLFPLFMSLGISQLFETVSSALQGRQPMPETGMTIFEHSLAFAEAVTVVRTSIGVGLFGLPEPPSNSVETTNQSSKANGEAIVMSVTRGMILDRLNVPPEALVISLISCLSHLSSHMLGLFGQQARFRLVNTAIWGSLFMGIFVYSFISFARPSRIEDAQFIRYPTVCIIGFMPHLVIIAGMIICATIYCVAIVSTLLSSYEDQRSFIDRVKLAHENMQVSASLANIKVRRSEDFYTFLLKTGYVMMSAATEAVYFNEAISVSMTPITWLENSRRDEIAESAPTVRGKIKNGSALSRGNKIPVELQDDFAGGEAFGLVDQEPGKMPDGSVPSSGYAKERKTTTDFSKAGAAATKETGVGISQRGGRWHMSARMIHEAVMLMVYCLARFTLNCMENLGGGPPQWLRRAARVPEQPNSVLAQSTRGEKELEFWMMSEEGEVLSPKDRQVDVEMETRRRIDRSGADTDVDTYLYRWFRNNGWWGDLDASGDYRPSPSVQDDDTTSVFSEASTAFTSEAESDGNRTPTARSPRPFSRETSPSMEEDHNARLAQLLDPKTLEDKQEAKLLSHHLRSENRPLTRSQYNRRVLYDKSRLLAPHLSPSHANRRGNLSPEDEESLLEQIILSRRASNGGNQSHNTNADASNSWSDGAPGLGSGSGPQCAICRSSPRTVLCWPCRCLSLCEECRISLAWNNFGSCVCCRRDVVAFSRLYVP